MSIAGATLHLAVSNATASYLLPNAATKFSLQLKGLPAIIGREPQADVRLLAPFVSRKHAVIGHDGQRWIIRDAGSKLGTIVNAVAASAEEPLELHSGDEIHIGPLTISVLLAGDADPTFNLMIPSDSTSDRTIVGRDLVGSVAAISEAELNGLAQQRLGVLLRSAARLTEAPNVEALAKALTQAASVGTGSPRAIWLEITGETEWAILGHFPPQTGLDELAISRSLVSLARQGKIAELQSGGEDAFGEAVSIETLNIRSAICAPIQVDNEVVGVLYLDTRGSESPIKRDAAAFCVGLTQLGGMALANLKRAELARKEREMRDELKAARAAQQQMLPDPSGSVGPIRYSLVAVPGMIVAGDMFDIIPLEDDCCLVLLGDVMGKGAAAGLMMATVQTFFRARGSATGDLVQLVAEANSYFYERFKGQGFVTLWIGRFQGPSGLSYVDAGHGHWGLLAPETGVQTLESEGGPPLGAFSSAEYESGELELTGGRRIILYSDGLTEQHNERGELFEANDVFGCLSRARSADDDVQLLLEAQDAFRGSIPLSDDLTIASIEWNNLRS